MENRRYDNIEYDESFRTTSSVTAQPLNASAYLNRGTRSLENIEPYNYNRNREYNKRDMYLKDDRYNEDEEEYNKSENKAKTVIKKSLTGTQRIIKFQLILCIIIGISFFAIQYISPKLFNEIVEVYRELYNASLVITDVGNIF